MDKNTYRGKRVDNGEWVYGYYVCLNGDKHFIYTGYAEIDCGSYYPDFYEVIPETVGQRTALKDMNGKAVFEGDIVESAYTKKPYTVCFGEYTYTDDYGDEQGACGWYNVEDGGYITAFGSPEEWATVIGNIHDNKLEGGNGR